MFYIKNLLINLIDIWVFLWPQILRNEAFMYLENQTIYSFIGPQNSHGLSRFRMVH